VVRRLRTVIALGFFADGDRLPKEADLAEQLGVTAFTLREALGVLRGEGLITTRPGKNGGSFVCLDVDTATFASDELRKVSAAELRDLGDWRRMLASVSASLAAQRASKSDITRLRSYAEALGAADGEIQARRAHCRFFVELAAAAQSTRMSRAEFAVYEEFDWLLGLALADPQQRAEGAQELTAIAEAVARRRPDAARVAAERHSQSIAESLMMLRLAAIAQKGAGELTATGDAAARSLADELTRVVEAIMGCLNGLADKAAKLLEHSIAEPELRRALSQAAMLDLLNLPLLVHGLGFMADHGVVPGQQLWMTWCNRTPEGVFLDERHVLNASRDDFYDYSSKEFFTVPRRTGRPWTQGPFVDSGGADDYIVTFAAPVFVNGQFAGVTGADVEVAALERHLAPWLVASGEQSMVINAERRVIVSNSATHIVGDVLPARSDPRVVRLRPLGWSVAPGGGASDDGS
jgi:DNA-binding FadR family transcriptional regulator